MWSPSSALAKVGYIIGMELGLVCLFESSHLEIESLGCPLLKR
jgi:hypothetical protein